MSELNQVISNEYLIISIVGSHANEDLSNIFLRKQQEIQKTSRAYWLVQSHKAKTALVQVFCEEARVEGFDVYCLFIEPAQPGGANPTLHDTVATAFSADNQDWKPFPDGIKVTGKISKSSTALIFDELKILNTPVAFNLGNCFEYRTGYPVNFMLGASTICCTHHSSGEQDTHLRKIVGFGKLTFPSAVYLRK